MIRVLATPTDRSNYETIVSLDGEDFILRLLWNARSGRWYMTLRDASNSDLATGRKVCADIPWASHETIDGMPAGQLWIYDITATDPGLRDLGQRTYILYAEEANVA